ncbi:MAG: DUF5060 domain-containing protein [Lacunisphaera sp.]|nr:DUF5060 domain-containing protein [Lacunisphaera sp.]
MNTLTHKLRQLRRLGWLMLALLGPLPGLTAQALGPAKAEPVKPVISGELKKWHKVTLTFAGPETAETDKVNPFMRYRLNVRFTHLETGRSLVVPGYFAADGQAGATSATAGNQWRVHLAPDETGTWRYQVDFRTGPWMAISERQNAGVSAGFMDGAEGTFSVAASDKTGRDNRAKGRLQYDGTRYLKYAETGKPMFKAGPDSPENFLAYADFDGTFHADGHKDNLVKTWEAHRQDWREGDPTWQDGKGKAIIGAVNYLAAKGLNVFSFLTLNIVGDDQNVFPFINYDSHDRFDCSKLDQWEVVLEHADKLGMFLHFKLLEQECQGLLDNGAIGAYTRLYYREMLARFGHHLALNWNLGEESGDWAKDHQTPPMNTTQRLAAAEFFHQNDPYRHHVVLHNPPAFDDILGPASKYTGVSVQDGSAEYRGVHAHAVKWIKASKAAGKQWAVAIDESGGADHGVLLDSEDPTHDLPRIYGLWGGFLAGTWGCEFYFGYKHPHSDLTCEDFRTRDLFWDQCRHLLEFAEGHQAAIIASDNHDQLVQQGDYCLASPGQFYAVFLKNGAGTIDLADQAGSFTVKWFDPRNGGSLQVGSVAEIQGGGVQTLSGPPSTPGKDWVVVISRKK